MGSIQDNAPCQRCNGVMSTIDYYRTSESASWCHRCGSVSSTRLQADNQQNLIKENKAGYGVYSLRYSAEEKQGSFHKPLTEADIEEFKKRLAETEVDVEKSFLAKWEDGKQVLVIGTQIPDMNHLDYTEFMEKYET